MKTITNTIKTKGWETDKIKTKHTKHKKTTQKLTQNK